MSLSVPFPGVTLPALYRTSRASRLPESLEEKRAIALRSWFVALAGRATAPADIMTISDSILEGNGVVSYLGRIPYLVLTRLRERFPTTGIAGGLGYIAPYMATGQVADWPVVNTGGITTSLGLGMRARLWTGAGQKSVFSFSGATKIGVRYYRSGTAGAVGTFTHKIDAGGTTTIDTKLSTASDFIGALLTIADTGAHTVTVEWASGAVIFDGFVHYNQDDAAGIRMWEGGHGGAATSVFAIAPQVTYLGNQANQIQPSLVIIELGVNDFVGATPISVATFSARIDTIISTVRANVTNPPSIVLIPVWDFEPSGSLAPWDDFVDVLYTKADADDDLCIYDFRQRVKLTLGISDTGRGILSTAEGAYPAHPSTLGAAYLAEGLARFLAPR